jgi:hypothetical protein
MADEKIEIPVELGSIFKSDPSAPVRGGGSRFVPMIPVGNDGTAMPCLWKSHYVVQAELADGSKVPAHECLLLVSRKPILTMRAEVAVDAWQHFGTGLIEW